MGGYSLGRFQVGSYRYRSLTTEGLYTVLEALQKPYIPQTPHL